MQQQYTIFLNRSTSLQQKQNDSQQHHNKSQHRNRSRSSQHRNKTDHNIENTKDKIMHQLSYILTLCKRSKVGQFSPKPEAEYIRKNPDKSQIQQEILQKTRSHQTSCDNYPRMRFSYHVLSCHIPYLDYKTRSINRIAPLH